MANTVPPNTLNPGLLKTNVGVVEQVKYEWESAVDSADLLICVLRKDGTVLRASRTIEQWGLGSVSDVSGMAMHDLMHPGCISKNCYFKRILGLSRKILATGTGVEYRGFDEILHVNTHIQLNPVEVDESEAHGYLVIIIRDTSKFDLVNTHMDEHTPWRLREPTKVQQLTRHQIPATEKSGANVLSPTIPKFRFIEKVKREWEAAIDSLSEIICLVDSHGIIVRTNRTIEKWKLGNVIVAKGCNLHEMLHPACQDEHCYLARLNEMIRDVDASGQVAEHQGFDHILNRHLHFQISMYSSLHVPQDGLALVLISNVSDVSRAAQDIEHLQSQLDALDEVRGSYQQKAKLRLQQEIEIHKPAEPELTLSRQEYHLLVNTMGEGMVIQDVERKIIYVNRAFLKMLGWPRSHVIGRQLKEFSDQDNLDGWSREKLENIKGHTATFEFRLNGKGKKHTWVKVSPQPRFDVDGNYIGSFAVITNINEHIEIEQKLLKTEIQLRSLSKQVLGAQELERKRIASELHDGIGQTLSAIKFYVENNICSMAQGGLPQESKIELVIPKLQNAIEEVRRISMDLRPSLLDDIGIVATLSWFCRESQQSFPQINFILDVVGIKESDIPPELKTEMFRIVQEAVNNACKYSGAKKVQISLKLEGQQIHLWIKDDGKGFDYTGIAGMQGYSESKGLGLASMRERAENSGGWFSVTSAVGSGAAVTCMWPVYRVPELAKDRRSTNTDRRARSR